MSRSNSESTIFLSDMKEQMQQKVKRAVTAQRGEPSEELDSLVSMGKALSPDKANHFDDYLS